MELSTLLIKFYRKTEIPVLSLEQFRFVVFGNNWFLHPLAMLIELPLILYEQNTIYDEQMYNIMDYKKT